MKRIAVLILALALLVAALAVSGRYFGTAARDAGAQTIVVPPGSSLREIAERLQASRAIGNALEFRAFARVFGSDAPIKAGEYRIRAGEGYLAILRRLQSGQVVQRFVTIPEGMPAILVYEKLNAVPQLTGAIVPPAEGSVLPDSYAYSSGETRAAVLKRMQAAMTRELDRLWRARKPGSAVKTPQEAVNLAAIVEKETGKPAERRMVAGVYSNRLRQGIPLQADPTVIYPVTKGRALGRRILRSELAADNGYNTYARAGLPQGPIANPGRLSIAAVLDPAETRALYFVADGTGGHVFADTLEQHNANVAKWYAIRRAKGEMK